MNLTIRPPDSIAELHLCEALQRRAWRMANDLNVVPAHVLLTAQKNGGVLLGAWDGGELVGFVFGFPGLTAKGKLKHLSHMLGIAPEYQGKGVGYQLKLAQRELVLRQGLDLVTWTFDPLESRNANLNIHKLGALCRTYIPDIYGAIAIGLYEGIPTDRFEVDWWVASERVQRCLAQQPDRPSPTEHVLANITGRTADGLLTPGAPVLDTNAPLVRVQIPSNYQSIKSADAGLALDWRMATRELFEIYFAAGYLAVDFITEHSGDERCSFYVLRSEGGNDAH